MTMGNLFTDEIEQEAITRIQKFARIAKAMAKGKDYKIVKY